MVYLCTWPPTNTPDDCQCLDSFVYSFPPWWCRAFSYQTAGGRLVGALAGHLEGDIVWGVALELEGSLCEMVEILVRS